MTWMLDWMVEVVPWGQPSVRRHGWLIGWLRTTFPIIEWSYHVTSMKESNIIVLLYCNIIFALFVIVGQVCWPRVLVIDLVYKGRVSLIVIHHLCVIIL